MHEKKAAPGKPILRPALREEARKHIGDTGLLDHLLKHMTDTVITNGDGLGLMLIEDTFKQIM
jgi:hypothetical protein